jgi:hypothetical protein
MSKFLLNLLLQISKALLNSKIQFLIQKFLFSLFRPGRPCGPLGLWPSQPTGRTAPAGRNRPGRPIQSAHRSHLCGKYVFLFGSRLPIGRLSLISLSTGPQLSDPPPSSRRSTRSTPPPRLAAIDRRPSMASTVNPRPLPTDISSPALPQPL